MASALNSVLMHTQILLKVVTILLFHSYSFSFNACQEAQSKQIKMCLLHFLVNHV